MIWLSIGFLVASGLLLAASTKQLEYKEGGQGAALLFMAAILAFCAAVATLAMWSAS